MFKIIHKEYTDSIGSWLWATGGICALKHIIGQKGITQSLLDSLNQALLDHELVKIKFIEFKEKKYKKQFAAEIEAKTGCRTAGIIGHMAIVFRRHPDSEKRKIILPKK